MLFYCVFFIDGDYPAMMIPVIKGSSGQPGILNSWLINLWLWHAF